MEAFWDQFTAAELLSYKEVLYDVATEEWYAPCHPKEVEREGRNCMRLARQFSHSAATHLERYFLHVYYTSQLGDDEDRGRSVGVGLDNLAERLYAEQSIGKEN